MTFKSAVLASLLLVLGACATPPPPERPVPRINQPELGASTLLSELARVAALSPEQRRRELAELENTRRLDDAKRFQLAALLERDDSPEGLERSLRALGALEEVDSRAQPLIELMKRSLRTRIELKQQTARTQELQDKLDQIKALEKSLQQRNAPAPPKTP